MSPKHISVIAIVSGIIFVVVVYNTISEELAVILAFLATVILVAGLVIERAYHRPDRFVEQLGEADILNRMWFPLQDELTDVVRTGGRVTEASSAWTTAPGLSKRETPGTFFREMEQYVRRRELVASLAASDLATEDAGSNWKQSSRDCYSWPRSCTKRSTRPSKRYRAHRPSEGPEARDRDLRTNGHRPPRPGQAPHQGRGRDNRPRCPEAHRHRPRPLRVPFKSALLPPAPRPLP